MVILSVMDFKSFSMVMILGRNLQMLELMEVV